MALAVVVSPLVPRGWLEGSARRMALGDEAMSTPPTGLRFSERELWDRCPDARDALFRLARMREEVRACDEVVGLLVEAVQSHPDSCRCAGCGYVNERLFGAKADYDLVTRRTVGVTRVSVDMRARDA